MLATSSRSPRFSQCCCLCFSACLSLLLSPLILRKAVMKFRDVFDLKQLKCEIAMQRALTRWQVPKVYGMECPFCGSPDYVKYSLEHGRQRYRCRGCKRRFTERTQFECTCQRPGKITKCHECPGFQAFVEVMRQYTAELQGLNLQQLQNLRAELEPTGNE